MGANLSPPTVENVEDSFGVDPKSPVMPTTCTGWSNNAQSSFWMSFSAFIHEKPGCPSRPFAPALSHVDLSQHSVEKHEDSLRAGQKSPVISMPCKGWSRKAQASDFGPGLSPSNVDKPEDSMRVVAKIPYAARTCTERAKNAQSRAPCGSTFCDARRWG